MAGQRNDHGKRHHSHGDYPDKGGSKRRNPGEERDTYAPGPDDTVYRILCPGRKIGSIIGRGGEIVKQLRSETLAKIRIGETIFGCEERVVMIYSSDRETRTFEDTGDGICAAQDALFKVHERLVTDESPHYEDGDAVAEVTARMLVPSDQVGSIIGKGGQIIQGIRSDTGAHIRVLKEHLPPFAISGDELVQISGDSAVVRKALFQISSCLHKNPSRSHHLLVSSLAPPPSSYPPVGQYGHPGAGPPVMGSTMGSYGGYKGDAAADWSFYPGSRDESSSREFSLRLLCPASCIGGVIGKGGGIIKMIRQESGATINVDSSTGEDDCIISISAREVFEDAISPTIEAAIRLQPRCCEKTEKDSDEASAYTTRLLVPTSRIGCLLGKGGSIISEMRRSTRANIRILSKESLPKVASEDDEMVQIGGDLEVSRNALRQITMRLKANVFDREGALSAFPAPVPYHAMSNVVLDGSKYGGRDRKPPGRGYSSHSSGYGASADFPPSGSNGGYGGSSHQDPSGNYGSYGGYSGRSGSAGFSGPNPVSHGKHHGY